MNTNANRREATMLTEQERQFLDMLAKVHSCQRIRSDFALRSRPSLR